MHHQLRHRTTRAPVGLEVEVADDRAAPVANRPPADARCVAGPVVPQHLLTTGATYRLLLSPYQCIALRRSSAVRASCQSSAARLRKRSTQWFLHTIPGWIGVFVVGVRGRRSAARRPNSLDPTLRTVPISFMLGAEFGPQPPHVQYQQSGCPEEVIPPILVSAAPE